MKNNHHHKKSSIFASSAEYAAVGISALFLFIGTGLVYLRTMHPTVAGGDCGELMGAAHELGTPHPPGYPTFAMYTYAAEYIALTFISPAAIDLGYVQNSAHVLLSTISVTLIFFAIYLLSTRSSSSSCGGGGGVGYNNTRRDGNENENPMTIAIATGIAGGVVGAGVFAFSPSVWLYAIHTEVFPLNNVFTAMLILLTVMYGIALQSEKYTQTSTSHHRRFVSFSAFCCGLGLTNQHTLVVFVAPIALWVLLSHEPTSVRRWITLSLYFLLGLTPYLYGPMVSFLHYRRGGGSLENLYTPSTNNANATTHNNAKISASTRHYHSTTASSSSSLFLDNFTPTQNYFALIAETLFSLFRPHDTYSSGTPPALSTWGNLHTWEGFWKHFLRAEYGTFSLASKESTYIVYDFQQMWEKYLRDIITQTSDYFWIFGVFGLRSTLRDLVSASRNSPGNIFRSPEMILIVTWIVYSCFFNYLSNMPLDSPLHYGVQQRFWIQPLAIVCVFIGLGTQHFLNLVFRFVVRLVMLPTSKQGPASVPTTAAATAASKSSKSKSKEEEGKSVVDLKKPSPSPKWFQLSSLFFIFLFTCGAVGYHGSMHFAENDESTNYYVRNYGKALLDGVPENAVVLTSGDLNLNSIRYMQALENYRPDVVVIDMELLTYSWYNDVLRRHPAVRELGLVFPGAHYFMFTGRYSDSYTMNEFLNINNLKRQKKVEKAQKRKKKKEKEEKSGGDGSGSGESSVSSVKPLRFFLVAGWKDGDDSWKETYTTRRWGLIEEVVFLHKVEQYTAQHHAIHSYSLQRFYSYEKNGDFFNDGQHDHGGGGAPPAEGAAAAAINMPHQPYPVSKNPLWPPKGRYGRFRWESEAGEKITSSVVHSSFALESLLGRVTEPRDDDKDGGKDDDDIELADREIQQRLENIITLYVSVNDTSKADAMRAEEMCFHGAGGMEQYYGSKDPTSNVNSVTNRASQRIIADVALLCGAIKARFMISLWLVRPANELNQIIVSDDHIALKRNIISADQQVYKALPTLVRRITSGGGRDRSFDAQLVEDWQKKLEWRLATNLVDHLQDWRIWKGDSRMGNAGPLFEAAATFAGRVQKSGGRDGGGYGKYLISRLHEIVTEYTQWQRSKKGNK